MNTIEVHTDSLPENVAAQIPSREALESTLQNAANKTLEFRDVDNAEISIAIVSDERIHEINRQFLNHDYPTDVITFELGTNPATDNFQAEIVVSAETAMQIAEEVDTTLEMELILYVIHGSLHLTGLDDHSDEDRIEMRKNERAMMNSLGLDYKFESPEPAE